MEKLRMETKNITDENIQKILELFPNVATEAIGENGELKTAIDFEKLKQELSEVVIDGEESYDFTWVGKKEAMVEANRPIRKTLRPDRESSVDWENTQNIYIEGDNLDALKLLQESYLGKVKMIYIDPPYNTGKDFVYRDNFTQDKESYNEELGVKDDDGNRLFQNTESNGRFHSDWCSMVYSRLKLARNLLSDDGVIFISIDDNEVRNLKNICDEIFGESNFYGSLIQLKGNTQNDSKTIQKNHEYILVYSKSNQDLLLTYNNEIKQIIYEDNFYLGRDTGSSSGHDKLLERPNLGYTIYYYEGTGNGITGNHNKLLERPNLGYINYSEFALFKKGDKFLHAVAVMDYNMEKISGDSKEEDVYKDIEDLISLGYVKIRPPKRKGDKLGRWTWGMNTFKELWNKDEVLIKNNKNVIKKEFVDKNDVVCVDDKKYYLKINKLPIQSIIKITNSLGTSILSGNDGLMPGIDFSNPKNPDLIKLFLSSYKTNDITILDFFSGSATTAHAVMQLNAEDGGNRKFIMVQLPEKTDEKSEAYKAGYPNICEIGKERIRRAGKKILAEMDCHGDKSPRNDMQKLDIGFRVFKVDDTSMKEVYYTPNELKQGQLGLLESNIKEDRTDEDLLYGCLLDWGVELSLPHKVELIEGKRVHIVDEDALIACFENEVPESVMRKIAEMKPTRVVFRDSSFASDDNKINIEEMFKLISPETTVKVI